MGICFQTIRSGSSGNLVTVWTARTRLIIDAGMRSQKEMRAILEQDMADPEPCALLVTHLHGDHINYHSLRVLEQRGWPIYLHRDNIDDLLLRHTNGRTFTGLNLRPFDKKSFRIGDFQVQPFELPHDGNSCNCGFAIEDQSDEAPKKFVMATDFFDWTAIAGHFVDADMIYVEANHCPELLRLYPNPASHFHLSNPRTGALLANVLKESRRLPETVILGHLSLERNNPKRALDTVQQTLKKQGQKQTLNLHIAPRRTPSPIFQLGDVPQPSTQQLDFLAEHP